ncbi:lipase, class 2 [Alkalihalophilus pseudofirmus OF4]|uniref:Lipase, class 2 n=1 Tax=Alkalihalophilus pseudofirmus (strain ATCC BAA-2126 / JCM 17055 / OF4) TaxID=398511 RepID=D3FQU1_ALKPO|nr:alpha/beta fold hydrolase [Alkalihalophilus pseudofirmus]ADC51461.1 lipase, class 2 [Alkalihalophilus pseudofirmus OF4]
MVKYSFQFIIAIAFFFVLPDHFKAGEAFLLEQGTPPPGANLPNCEPASDKPNPVILVPGTFERSAQNWLTLSPELAKKGYCVYAMNYGLTHSGPSTGDIKESAIELNEFVDNVLQLTGADKVDIIGHSQGGMMPRYYLKFLGGDKFVENLIAFVPSNHGTTGFFGLEQINSGAADITSCLACQQQLVGSEFLEELNKGNETPGNVSYTVISTKTDQVVIPYTSAFLDGPEKQVSNITIQDYYRFNLIGHQGIVYDQLSFSFVFDALEHEGPANPERAVKR